MATATDKLSQRADALADMLSVLSRLTNESTALLDSLGGSLRELGALTAPIHVRASALTAAQRNVGAVKAEVDGLLRHLGTVRRVASTLAAGPAGAGGDAAAFLAALEALKTSIAALRGHDSLSAVQAALGQAQGMFDRALAACAADFSASLAAGTRAGAVPPQWLLQRLDEPITEASRAELARPAMPPELVPKLRRMAAVMADAGHAGGRGGYVASRERALAAALRGVAPEPPEPLDAGLAALPPDALERAVAAWARRLRALALLALGERALADDVWPAPAAAELFGAALAGPLAQAARAGNAIIAAAQRSPDKLFALLELYGHLQHAIPALGVALAAPRRPEGGDEGEPEAGAADAGLVATTHTAAGIDDAGGEGGGGVPEPCVAPLAACAELAPLAAAAAAGLVTAYVEAVRRDASHILPPDGTVHPLTAQVVSYVKRLLSYRGAAHILFGDSSGGGKRSDVDRVTGSKVDDVSSGEGSDDDDDDDDAGADDGSDDNAGGTGSPAAAVLAARVRELLAALQDNLAAKAAHGYRAEPALAALFLMNNLHYVVGGAEGGPTEALLGREWLEGVKDGVEASGARYQTATWGPVLALLSAPAPQDVGALKQHLRETLTAFNAAVERIHAEQSAWTVPDPALRAAVRRVARADVVEPYQAFLRAHADVPFAPNDRPGDRYIRYAAADVGALIDDDLLEGRPLPSAKLDLKRSKLNALL